MKPKEPLKPADRAIPRGSAASEGRWGAADEAIDQRLARILAQVRTHAGRQLEFPWLGK